MSIIALIEDETSLNELIKFNLELEGHSVISFINGYEALVSVSKLEKTDLIILDIMLPEVSGLELCETIRKTSDVPILFLSAKGTTADRITGLKRGGTDYLVKPFDLEELLLKVSILLKPQKINNPQNTIKINTKTVNFNTFEVCDENNFIVSILTKKEIDLLRLFASKSGEVVSRDEILDVVWGQDQYPSSRTVDNFIVGFRKLFETDQRKPKFFHSIRGVGYKFIKS
ncbi:MAG: response regulator transcription factor [Bacteroidetes bacterium]|nr:response regulator transcription factor [Bacteroidota bacterium]